MINIPANIFHDASEQALAVLGNSYLASFLSGGILQKSIIILTDKRLYQKGKIWARDYRGALHRTSGSQTVPVRDVTGSAYIIRRPTWMLIAAVALFILSLIFVRFSEGSYASASAVMFVLCVIFIVLYVLLKKNIFEIHYSGGIMATECNWYGSKELEDFHRTLSLVQDMVKKQ